MSSVLFDGDRCLLSELYVTQAYCTDCVYVIASDASELHVRNVILSLCVSYVDVEHGLYV